MQTKNMEQSDASAISLGASFTAAVGTTQATRTGALELVRYTYQLSSPTTAQWVHMRANPPIWQLN